MKPHLSIKLTPTQIKVIQECARDKAAFGKLLDLFKEVTVTMDVHPALTEAKKREDKQLTIFLVDDEVAIIESTEQVLVAEGHRVITCTDPLTAVALMEKDVPDLALLDVEMPAMDGGELLARMKLHPVLKAVPVVFLTGLVNQEEEPVLNVEGVHEFLAKPYTITKLLNVINKVTSFSRQV